MTKAMPTTETALSRLGWVAVGLLLLVMGLIGLISAGVFDPPAAAGTGETMVLNQPLTTTSATIEWLDQSITPPATIRLTANYVAGELDSGYGLVIGSPEQYLLLAVSPVGYATVEERQPAGPTPHFLWQTWPHVATETAANELQLDLTGSSLTARINREWLWAGEVAWDDGLAVGVYVETFGRSVTVHFQQLQRFIP